jgi:hypothetical protein
MRLTGKKKTLLHFLPFFLPVLSPLPGSSGSSTSSVRRGSRKILSGKPENVGSGPTFVSDVAVLVVMAAGAVYTKVCPSVVTVVVPDSVIGGPVPI